MKFAFIGGSRIGLTYGPITSSIDDKKAKRRNHNTSNTLFNGIYQKDAEKFPSDVVSGEQSLEFYIVRSALIMLDQIKLNQNLHDLLLLLLI